ncbi:MAG: D-2-hydroxyacid dehydrogenase [Bacteroidaceae bacterium]|nr:D-2-hydroxyacid dehydrogenase [Bacteroidaceae bacterium]
MEKKNIVVLDGYTLNPGDLSWDALKALGNCTIYDRTAAADVVERCKDADIVLTNKVLIREAEMEQLPRLRYIGVLATGYNVVDTVAAAARGIVVTNIPAYSTDSVAQMVFAHLLNIVNAVQLHTDSARAGEWSRCADFSYMLSPQTELAGKTLGIVGLGNIGRRVARIADAFGMRVIAKTSKRAEELPEYITPVTLDQLLAESDVITLHCPLTPDTQHIINANTIARMKQGAILINTGRGPLIDEAAVAEALNSGKLRAAGFDVLAVEPALQDNPLLTARNAFITPHIAWATAEARARLMNIMLHNIEAFLAGNVINKVN